MKYQGFTGGPLEQQEYVVPAHVGDKIWRSTVACSITNKFEQLRKVPLENTLPIGYRDLQTNGLLESASKRLAFISERQAQSLRKCKGNLLSNRRN